MLTTTSLDFNKQIYNLTSKSFFLYFSFINNNKKLFYFFPKKFFTKLHKNNTFKNQQKKINQIFSDYEFILTCFLNIYISYVFWLKARTSYYVNNWIYTTNHKRIAINYFWFVILSGIVGMVLATVIRLEFAYPGVGVFAGDSIQYLSLASAHGVIMVFFMIMPLLFGAFANFLLPTQLGVHDVAFPRLNSAAFWFLPGGLLMLCQLVCVDRRYQRMNCFNIREIQSLLKQKFFNDLVNTKDNRILLNKTSINLRFKTENINSINSNMMISYLYGLNNSFLNKNQNFSTNFDINNKSTENFFFFNFFKNSNFNFYNLINKFLNFNFFF